MKKILKIIGIILGILVGLALAGVGVLTITEYRPDDVETVIESHLIREELGVGEKLTLVTWNCGYGALGDNADFFMDGGSSVYTADKDRVRENLAGIRDVLMNEIKINGNTVKPDLIVLQEVDINSSRSHGIDEREVLREAMPEGKEAFAYNFKALYVPYPLPPIGHVESGLYTLSRADIRQAERISLPCPFSWPVRIVNLKRCLLVSRIPLQGSDHELVLINLHLEAYDDGEGKVKQTEQLLEFMLDEYVKGNYVIAAGDFNQRFSNTDKDRFPVLSDDYWQPGDIDADAFGDEFELIMDKDSPTCRSLDKAYAGADKARFQFYQIDGFIVSDNVQVENVETQDDHDFQYSDHNPVVMEFILMPEAG